MHHLGEDLEGQRIDGIALHQFSPGLLVAKEALVFEQLLAGRQSQTAQLEQAQRGLAASEYSQIRELIATGEQQATLMGGLSHVPDQGRIPFIHLPVAALNNALLETR